MLTKAYNNTIINNKNNSCVPPGFSDYETSHCYKLPMLELKGLCTTWVLNEDQPTYVQNEHTWSGATNDNLLDMIPTHI